MREGDALVAAVPRPPLVAGSGSIREPMTPEKRIRALQVTRDNLRYVKLALEQCASARTRISSPSRSATTLLFPRPRAPLKYAASGNHRAGRLGALHVGAAGRFFAAGVLPVRVRPQALTSPAMPATSSRCGALPVPSPAGVRPTTTVAALRIEMSWRLAGCPTEACASGDQAARLGSRSSGEADSRARSEHMFALGIGTRSLRAGRRSRARLRRQYVIRLKTS